MNNPEIKNLIDELKTLVLELHRSAGELDNYIQLLESEMNCTDGEFIEHYIKYLYRVRVDVKRNKRYSSIDSRENSIWERLALEAKKIEA